MHWADDGTELSALAARLDARRGIVREAPAPKIEKPRKRRMAAAAPVMAPATVAVDGGKLAPCERCGRTDFATAAGRAWHVANNPDCVKYRKPDRHQYIGA
jgi:hypothetical protein